MRWSWNAFFCAIGACNPYYVADTTPVSDESSGMTRITRRHVRAMTDSLRPKVLDDCSAKEIQEIADKVFSH